MTFLKFGHIIRSNEGVFMAYNIPNKELEKRKIVDFDNDLFFSNYETVNAIDSMGESDDFVQSILLEGEYPKQLKHLVKILSEYTDKDNLYNLAVNLTSVKLERKNPFVWLVLNNSYGTYDSRNNIITYFNKASIPHELLHLASTVDGSYSGFNVLKHGVNFANGLNEGYTEMLSQRIFFDELFTKSAYKTDVYLLRIFELLYDEPKEMERAYFNADYENPIRTFLKYGSLDEYKFLMKNLDYFAVTDIWNDEENVVFAFLINLLYKTGVRSKVNMAYDIYEEYLSSEKNKTR